MAAAVMEANAVAAAAVTAASVNVAAIAASIAAAIIAIAIAVAIAAIIEVAVAAQRAPANSADDRRGDRPIVAVTEVMTAMDVVVMDVMVVV